MVLELCLGRLYDSLAIKDRSNDGQRVLSFGSMPEAIVMCFAIFVWKCKISRDRDVQGEERERERSKTEKLRNRSTFCKESWGSWGSWGNWKKMVRCLILAKHISTGDARWMSDHVGPLKTWTADRRMAGMLCAGMRYHEIAGGSQCMSVLVSEKAPRTFETLRNMYVYFQWQTQQAWWQYKIWQACSKFRWFAVDFPIFAFWIARNGSMFCRSPRFLRQLVLAVHALVCFSLRMSNLESNLFGSNGFQRFLNDDVETRWTTLNHVETLAMLNFGLLFLFWNVLKTLRES